MSVKAIALWRRPVSEIKPLIRSLVPEAVTAHLAAAGLPGFRARQLNPWLFSHGVMDWDAMSNLPADLRQNLAARFDLSGLTLDLRQVSTDHTRKYLFRLRDGQTVESVLIPMRDHATFCISSQVGCGMACRFCATARGGLVRNLEAGEIIEQILHLQRDAQAEPVPGLGGRGFNVVFMGMGEPLDNWDAVRDSLRIMQATDGLAMSRRRIQVSTSGPAAGLHRLIEDAPGVGLTLSLGGSNDVERKQVMPVPGRTSTTEAVDLAATYARAAGITATLAWVMIAGKTDAADMARRLGALARRGPFKVNLIPLNLLDDDALDRTHTAGILAFQKILTDMGIKAFIRASGGQDIDAACGQLRRRRQASP